MTNTFIEVLNSKLFQDERVFKYKSSTVDNKKNIKVELLISHDDYQDKLNDELRKKVKGIAEEILPENYSVTIDYIIAVHDEATLIRLMLEYMQKERPNFYSLFAAVPIHVEFNNNFVTITIQLEKFLHDYALESSLDKDLIAFFDTIVFEDIEILYDVIPNSEGAEIKQTEYQADPVRYINVKTDKLFTRNEFSIVRYISDVKEKENPAVTLCGKISGIRNRFIEKIGKYIYSFTISDTTATIKGKYFAKPNEKFDWNDVFVDNNSLLFSGAIQYDKFDNSLVYMINRIASCEIDFDSIDIKSNFNKEYSDYRFILPEPFHDVAQENFFEAEETSSDFGDIVYCAFDLETTGLDVASDEIIELAAIKIEKGQLTEAFSTFVRPTRSIPERVQEITGIKDEDVALAPLPQDVFADFYKFCKGTTFVGHNIVGYDIPLLNNNAMKYRYEFNNDAVDTLLLAKNYFPNEKNKLIDVCNRLGVPLIDAHRAINDVAATAKVFLKLMKMKKNNE